MKKNLVLFCLGLIVFLAVSVCSAAEELESSILSNTEDLGVPTVEYVNELEQKAMQLFESEDWENASVALESFIKNANFIANIIVAGLEPFYSGSYDDRKNFSYTKVNILSKYEKVANEYKSNRNHAMVMLAECYINLGQKELAVKTLSEALDIIDIDDWDWWQRAMKSLYKIVGIEVE